MLNIFKSLRQRIKSYRLEAEQLGMEHPRAKRLLEEADKLEEKIIRANKIIKKTFGQYKKYIVTK